MAAIHRSVPAAAVGPGNDLPTGVRLRYHSPWLEHRRLTPSSKTLRVRPRCERNGMTGFHRRQFLHLAGGVVALSAIPRVASAQAYPSRPVRLLVGFAPG